MWYKSDHSKNVGILWNSCCNSILIQNTIMKTFGISEPCSENWANMTPNEKGAFCSNCAKDVVDWSKLSEQELLTQMNSVVGKNACVRMEVSQYQSVVDKYNQWHASHERQIRAAGFVAIFIVFGMSLFACNSPKEAEDLSKIHTQMTEMLQSEEVIPPKDSIKEMPKKATTENEIPEVMLMGMVAWEGENEIIDPGPDRNKKANNLEDSLGTELEPVIIQGKIPNKVRDHQYMIQGLMPLRPEHIKVLEKVILTESLTSDENGNPLPVEYDALLFPNPSHGESTLKLELPKAQNLTLQLFDMNGRLIQKWEPKGV